MSTACPSHPPIRCTCMSVSPGISTLPLRSVTLAPRGTLTEAAGPADSMLVPRTTTVACSTAGEPVPSISTAFVKACTAGADASAAPARAGATPIAPPRKSAAPKSPQGPPAKRRREARRVPWSLPGLRFRMRLLEAHPPFDADGPRRTDHEAGMTRLFRSDQDGIAQVRMLIREVLDEQGHLVALVPAPEPQVREVVPGAIPRTDHVVVRRIARPDMGIVGTRKARPAGGQGALVLEIRRGRDLRNLVDGAPGLLRSARPLLGDGCIHVAESDAERQLAQQPSAEFELEARAARATRVARVTVAAERQVNCLLDLVPVDGEPRAVQREAPVREARLEPCFVVPETV